MANKLTDEKREELFQAWKTKQSYESVARKCGVSHQTARRYRTVDSWDKRLEKIQQRTQQKLDTQYVNERAKRVHAIDGIIGTAINEYVQKINNKEPLNLSVAELNTLIRLEQFLAGEADSRPDQPETTYNIQLTKDEHSEMSAAYREVVAELERRGINCN